MRISVTMATRDGAKWLKEQLASLVGQARQPDELLIFDDCSEDQSVSILRQFAAGAPFSVRVVARSVSVGVTANFQSAFAEASGDVIVPCDQDDVWYPEKLARIEQCFSSDPELDLLFSDADVVDENLCPLAYKLWQAVGLSDREKRRATRSGLASVLVKFNVVTGSAMAFSARRRDLLLPIPSQWMHDGWIALLLAVTGRCRWLPEPLMAYRQRPGQLIGAPRRSWVQQMQVARRMDAEYFDRLAANFQACLDRLAEQHVAIAPVVRAMLQSKVGHCLARRDMRQHDSRSLPPRKITAMARELIHRRYASASLGWKSAMQDLLLT